MDYRSNPRRGNEAGNELEEKGRRNALGGGGCCAAGAALLLLLQLLLPLSAPVERVHQGGILPVLLILWHLVLVLLLIAHIIHDDVADVDVLWVLVPRADQGIVQLIGALHLQIDPGE